MSLKEKRVRNVKGQSYSYCRKQQEESQKKDATPPTVELEFILITSVIDAKERRDVAVVNIPG